MSNNPLEFLRQQGLVVDTLPPDGVLERVATIDKPHSKNGWIIAYSEPLTVVYGDWRIGEKNIWTAKSQNTMTPEEKKAFNQRLEQARKLREADQQARHKEASDNAKYIYNNASNCLNHAYLTAKGVKPCQGLKIAKDGRLIVPLYNEHNQIVSCQFINDAGEKRFLSGGKKSACFFCIKEKDNLTKPDIQREAEKLKPLLICEGLATGLSLNEASNYSVLVAFDAGNLEAVATLARKLYPERKIILCADNDIQSEVNTGVQTATAVAKLINGFLAIPPNINNKSIDFNDLHQLKGLEVVKDIIYGAESQKETLKQGITCLNIEDLLKYEFPPREFILSPILPKQGLAMIHAPRGVGKTYASLTIAYAVATGGVAFDRWKSPKPSRVLLIDGEMPAVTLQERLASLVAGNDLEPPQSDYLKILTPDMQPEAMPNLATLAGQLAVEPFIVEADLIVIDNLATLARAGRSNDEESWLPMQMWLLDLRRRGKSVLLVHHANKNGEQRGTSAKEDILDTSIKLSRPADYEPDQGARFEIHLTKARGICGAEASPFEVQLSINNGLLKWTSRDLQDLEVEQLKVLLESGLSIRECAEEMSVSKSKVGRIKKELDSLKRTPKIDNLKNKPDCNEAKVFNSVQRGGDLWA